jgi:hypothetical protein
MKNPIAAISEVELRIFPEKRSHPQEIEGGFWLILGSQGE